MPKPDATSEKAAMPGDDLEKQVDDMLDALEEQAEALFDSIADGPDTEDEPLNAVIASVVADAEPPASTAEAPSPVKAADEPTADPAIDRAIDEAAAQAADAIDTAKPAPIAAPPSPDPASQAVDEAAFSGAPDETGGGEPDPALDQAIAQAVADAEQALDQATTDPVADEPHPLDEALDDAVAQAVSEVESDELPPPRAAPIANTPAPPSATQSAPPPKAAATPPAPAPSSTQAAAPPKPSSTQTAAPIAPQGPAEAPIAEAKPAKGNAVAALIGRLKPAARAGLEKSKPVLKKGGLASAQIMSKPLVLLSPSARDYLGYAAIVTAFMGLCVWILSII